MSRKASVSAEMVAEKAMPLFWLKGFTGTSVNDLVETTKASKTMIYSLDGKKGVFIQSFYYYMQNISNPYWVTLENDSRGLEAFRDTVTVFIDALLEGSMVKACLFVNTTVELGKRDKDIDELIHGYLKRNRKAFRTVLERAHKLGEIKNYSSIPMYTELLLNALFSLSVLYKVRSKSELTSFMHSQIDLIR